MEHNEAVAEATRTYAGLLEDLRAPIDEYFKPVWLDRMDSSVRDRWDGPYIRVGPQQGVVHVPSNLDYQGFEEAVAAVCAKHHFQEPTELQSGPQGILHMLAHDSRGSMLWIWFGEPLELWVEVTYKPSV